MACSSCSSGGGTPRGCKNNGTCSSGGCNKLGVFDWLANMQLPNGQAPYDILEIRFKNSRKSFFRNAKNLSLQVGDAVAVEASPGFDIGIVSVVGELARIQVKKKAPSLKPMEARKIIRIATQEDMDRWGEARSLEREVMFQARTLAVNLGLEMKISDVEYQGDLTKATFYYTAEGRVDFRQLIKDMADKFKIRIEMRQIGSRQEAQRLGGIGSCGRELCCSTWLTDFRSVSTSAARYQQLSLNPQKLAGQCGKLKCCLNYELDMYLDAIKSFPSTEAKLQTVKGFANHVKTDVFKRQMWYILHEEGAFAPALVPLTPERVKEILKMNQEGKKPQDLKEYEKIVEKKEPDYDNVVGQDSLNRFDNKFTSNNKKKKKKKPQAQANSANQPVRPAGAEVKTAPVVGQQPKKPQHNHPRPQGQKGPRPEQRAASPENAAAPAQNQNPEAKTEGGAPKKRFNKRRNPRKNNGPNEKPTNQ